MAWYARVRLGMISVREAAAIFDAASLSGKGAGVESIERLLERFERDEFDMVAIGRALLADPLWSQKVLEDRQHELVPFTKDAVVNLY